MIVLYFGTYDASYSRNRVMIKALRSQGIEIRECHETYRGALTWLRLAWKFMRMKKDFDLVIVGFSGPKDLLLARMLTRKPIVFDALISQYLTYVHDRDYVRPHSLGARWYRFLDTLTYKLADLVLLDTQAHIGYFARELGLSASKLRQVWVGTVTDVFYPRQEQKNNSTFLVHFHGHYIPLQGVEYIIRAAKLLEHENIEFQLIGKGQTLKRTKQLAIQLGVKNVSFLQKVKYEELPDLMSRADICLGIFGDEIKTELVIPNKVFEALAMAKPVITADTSAVRELLTDRESILLCKKADERDLANKIMTLRDNPDLRARIANSGYDVFIRQASEEHIGRNLRTIFLDVLKNKV